MPKDPTFNKSVSLAGVCTAIVTDVTGKPWWLDPVEGTIRPVKFIHEEAAKPLTPKAK